MGDLISEDHKYLTWLHDKSQDAVIKAAAYIVLSHKADIQNNNANEIEIPPDMFSEAPF